jgi:hypothetical protein
MKAILKEEGAPILNASLSRNEKIARAKREREINTILEVPPQY